MPCRTMNLPELTMELLWPTPSTLSPVFEGGAGGFSLFFLFSLSLSGPFLNVSAVMPRLFVVPRLLPGDERNEIVWFAELWDLIV